MVQRKKNKIYLHLIKEWDSKYRTSYVRDLEIAIDRFTHYNGYKLQFWRDCEVSGLDEAILYLTNNFPDRDIKEVESVAKLIRDRI